MNYEGSIVNQDNTISQLQNIKMVLDELEINSHFVRKGANISYDQLYLALSNSQDENDIEAFVMILSLLNSMDGSPPINPEQKKDDDVDILQMTVILSLDTSEELLYNTAFLLSNINRIIPLGCFCMTEDNQIFYKYSLASQFEDSEPMNCYFDPVLIIDTIGFISDIVFKIYPLLVNFAKGAISETAVLSELSK